MIEGHTDRNSIVRSQFWSQSGYHHSWKLSRSLGPTAGEDNHDVHAFQRAPSKRDVLCTHFCPESSTAADGREEVRTPTGRLGDNDQVTTAPSVLPPPGNANTPALLRAARNNQGKHPGPGRGPLSHSCIPPAPRTRGEPRPQVISISEPSPPAVMTPDLTP